MNNIRAFIAVVPPNDVLDQMESFLSCLRLFADYKWFTRAQLHLTLRFIGEVSANVLDEIAQKLEGIKLSPFEISLDHAGAFASFSRARVIWLSGTRGAFELRELAAQYEKIAVLWGLPPETKKFSPHLIARTRPEEKIPQNLESALKQIPSFSWNCAGFTLMQSQLPRIERFTLRCGNMDVARFFRFFYIL